MTDPGASSIAVTVRVRPFTITEAAAISKCDDAVFFLGEGSLAGPAPKLSKKGIRPVIKVVDEKCLIFDPPEDSPIQKFSRTIAPTGKRVKDQTFGFDRVFDENTTQGDVYEATTKGLLDSVLEGYNATVFAYGATGCGKTHTITGTAQHPGIIFMTMQELFEKIADRSDEKHTEISLSYLEIYNETIRDLLVPGGSKQGLMLREDANQAVSVAGLTSHHPKDVQEVMDMIVQGNEYRTVSPTAANATSSRSHAVLQINVSQKDRNADINEPHTMATLSIIDLAGSERASATKNRGERLLEGANINKSLLALGSCINALCDPRKKNHVPYRNSKLTRLLKFSLGGNCKTVMIVCVSPSSAHFDETQNTLRYANRAKNIQTKVTRNVYNVNRHVKDFLVKIDEQMALINELRAQQKDYESVAFAKFKKQIEKRDGICREGMLRIRAAHENSANERLEKMTNMKKLRQIERRIGMLSAWIAGFDTVVDMREQDDMPPSLATMRTTAQGIQLELENSRQHYHQRIAKCSWERVLDSALHLSLRQLAELDGQTDGTDAGCLTREVECLKANAARDAAQEVLAQEKGADMDTIQVLLSTQIDVVSSLHDILGMTEEEAVQHAKDTLKRLFQSCTSAVSHIVKPDGSLNTTEIFPPSKRGTPKRRKPIMLADTQVRPHALPTLVPASPVKLMSSPLKSASPRRFKAAVGKKGIAFSPKKKSPSKRSVRWRDDANSGALAEFEKTPKKMDSSPDVPAANTTENAQSQMPSKAPTDVFDDSLNSSPTPVPPETSLDLKPRNNRFQAGFLAKKSEDSPLAPTITKLGLSDSDDSPLRTIDMTKSNNRSNLSQVEGGNSTLPDSGNNSSSEAENTSWPVDRADTAKIKMALKRVSSAGRASHGHSLSDTTNRTQRRRSPTAATVASSPPSDSGLFTASHARRMVNSQREGLPFHSSVLSPRGAPVVKNAVRRTTISAEGRQGALLGPGAQAVRQPSSTASTPKTRESVAGGSVRGTAIWR